MNSELDDKFNPTFDRKIRAFALFYYSVDNVSQAILHNLKYKHNQAIGHVYGFKMAVTFTHHSKDIECLMPVPIHPRKKFKRGYNQSECIAAGMKKAWGVPVDLNCITRTKHTESQTKKNSLNRREAVKNVFQVNANHLRKYHHIGLVDDVITTGATLEAIVSRIKEVHPEVRITIFALGYTA